ncbi:MAG TPA: sugar ABC transporter ATP-binding protein [Jatrophihabitantaceae bacterium]|jgi:simple sugar transport system ATP-binding protein
MDKPTQPVADVVGVSKRFGATLALDDVQLAVAPGEVHALVGRNGAGKSTLVTILTGLAAPDSGTVHFGGAPAPPLGDRLAWRQVVACVYQKLTIIPGLSVAENLFLNRQAPAGKIIGWSALRRQARDLLDAWALDVDPRVPAGELNVEQRQLLEIARALSFGARFIILDEPTARLDAGGIARLFERIRALQNQGVTFLFISHHLQEIFELCQRVTVFRDARHIVTAPIDDISHTALVEAMTGEPVSEMSDPRPPRPDAASPVLEVNGLTAGEQCHDVSFEVGAGEIVGLAGAGASGKFAVADSIAGFVRPDDGTIRVDGRPLRPGSVPRALHAGVGVVPRDRHREGFVGGLSIAENTTMTVPHRLGRHGFASPRQRTALGRAAIRTLDIVPTRPEAAVADLSGGNQQKVVMARALADQPHVLVLMAPTLGVDVKSKQAVMDQAVVAARGGAGVLLVTDDLDDLRYCHRVLVMFRGEIVATMTGTWDDREVVAAMEGVDLSHD